MMAQRDLAASLRRQHHGKADNAYAEGRNACRRGEARSGCPHKSAEMREAWLRGWDEAQAEFEAS